MPTVVREKGYEFIVHTRELPFEPPHVHVRFGDDEVRIELNGGTFMEDPPTGKRRTIAFLNHLCRRSCFDFTLRVTLSTNGVRNRSS
jgi:hypothetical protein